MEPKQHHAQGSSTKHGENHYPHLYLMSALSFVAMFVLMYAMVDRLPHVFVNLNQFYMAGLMVAPMVLIELAVMRAMYPNKKLNLIVGGVSALALVLFWILIRQQAAIGNTQFLRSMIPHHAGAVLMCEQLKATDPDIKQLCAEIIRSQNAEIAQMESKLRQLD